MKIIPLILLVILSLVSLFLGIENASWEKIISLFGAQKDLIFQQIIFDIRLPRILGTILVGSMLAGAGCASQNLFRNSLASAHTLGITSSAALGAVIAMCLNLNMTLGSLIFSLISLIIIFIPGFRCCWHGTMLILAGVAINAFTSALTSGALFLSNEKLSSLVFWLMGGFWRITYIDCLLLLTSLLLGFGILFYFHKEMDIMLLGDRNTLLLGVNLSLFKPLILFSIAILSASSVCCAGIIGFVGLAIPHIIRLFGVTRFKQLLFQSAIGGALLLLVADLISRSSFAPLEIPVGILTSLLGGPFFFYLLLKNKGNKI